MSGLCRVKPCPYCGSNNVDHVDTVDTIDVIDIIDDRPLYLTIEVYVCLECGKEFDDEGTYLGQR